MAADAPIPLLDLKEQYKSIQAEIEPKLLKIFESQGFILGPEVQEFERKIAEYCEVPYAVGVSSGTDALLIALMVCELEPGSEVITTPYTFFATGGAIARAGLTPVFVDIDPVTYNLNVQQIEARITARTRVIMPVHLYGQCAEMDEITAIAAKHNLTVIEDAAQAIGARINGRSAGSIGDFGAFSFFPSKNLGGFGDAGLVTCKDPALYEALSAYRVHGSKKRYYHDNVGGNFRIDTLQAAVLSVKLSHLDGWTEHRRQNARLYASLFTESGILQETTADGTPLLQLPTEKAGRFHVFNQYVIRTPFRDALLEQLRAEQIGCEVYYPVPLHLQRCFTSLGFSTGSFPESERASRETLAIPIYPELGEQRLTRVAERIIATLRKLSR